MSTIFIKGLNALRADITRLGNKVNSDVLNDARANAFKDYAAVEIASDSVGLRSISAATAQISGEHAPINETSLLLKNIKVDTRTRDNVAKTKVTEAGYFTNSKRYPKKDEYSGKLKLNQIATLHHTGYRIPLQGDKGNKVRSYLKKEHGIIISPNKQFIQVPPRPFLYKAAEKFANSGKDTAVIDKYMKDLLNV